MKHPRHLLAALAALTLAATSSEHPRAQTSETRLRKRDLRSDVVLTTSEGAIRLRLSDQTPLHRDNFLRLVKAGFYDGISFHRVIRNFMVQAGDPRTRTGADTANRAAHTLPAEFRPDLYHRRGALAAARMGDDVNPQKASSGAQFYIVQGRTFTDAGLDSVETYRLKGRKLPEAHRATYRIEGGAPHLDQNYTVFGQAIEGMDVVDRIAAQPTTGRSGADRPLSDIRIRSARLVKRKRQG